jgi:hypothetical protein
MNALININCRSAPRARIFFADAIRSYSVMIMTWMVLFTPPAFAADSLDLEGTTITGSQELPKALHIVPWKSSEAGDLAGRPLNSLVDEILAPIDRDVFLRELEYYEAVHSSE